MEDTLDFFLADIRVVSYEQKALLGQLLVALSELLAKDVNPVINVPTNTPTIQVESPALDLSALTELFLQHQRHTSNTLDEIKKLVAEFKNQPQQRIVQGGGPTALKIVNSEGSTNVWHQDGGLLTHPVADLSETASHSRSMASTTPYVLMPVNSERIGATIQVEETASDMYVLFGEGVSTTNYSMILKPGDYWYSSPPRHSGIVTAVWSGAVGAAQVTEFFSADL